MCSLVLARPAAVRSSSKSFSIIYCLHFSQEAYAKQREGKFTFPSAKLETIMFNMRFERGTGWVGVKILIPMLV